METFFELSFLAFLSSSQVASVTKKRIVLIVGMLCVLAAASNVTAAPFEIEGVIKQVRTIETKPPYTFGGTAVISIYVVGHRYGKDFDYQYMVVKDTTQLGGISFSELETGKYVRVKSRAEPPGMVGKPIQDIRASRYGCCNFALHVDTVSTPRNITASVIGVESFGPGEIVVTVCEDKTGAREFKYLVADGKTTIRNGGFSDIKVSARIDIANAGINVPVPPGVDHGKLHGADLFAASVAMNQSVEQKEIPTDGLKLWFRADRGVTHSDNKVSQWEDQSGSNLHAKTAGGQPMLLTSAIGGKPAIHLNGKGDMLEFSGWSPNGLTEMTITIISANTEFQPEPYKGGWDEGGHCGTLQSVLNWPEQPGTGPHAWGNVILSAFQKSVSYRFGTGQLSNSNNWKRPASIGDSPTLTTAIHDGATEKVYVEGELVWTQTDKLTTIKNCATYGYIGRWSHGGDNSGWFAGNVAEIIVYTRALDDTDRKKVEDYLKAKYFADKKSAH